MEFTEKQIENFKAFVGVQQSGIINMFDARNGCEITGMDRDEWRFCMTNYEQLEEVIKDNE